MPIKQGTQIRYRSDIPVPPWKEFKMENGSYPLVFVIKSKTIISKKNGAVAYAERDKALKFAKDIFKRKPVMTKDEVNECINLVYGKLVRNTKYRAFIAEQKPALQKQMQSYSERLQDKGLIFPLTKCKITMKFYFKADFNQDLDNKSSTILDCLVDCGILADDNVKIIPELIIKGAIYKDEIVDNICQVSISVNLKN